MAFENIKQMITDKKAARRARIDAKEYGPIGSDGEGYDPGNPYNLGPGEESFTPDPGFNQRLMERGPEPNFDAGDWDLYNPEERPHLFDKQREEWAETEPGYNYLTTMSPKGYEGWELPPSGPLDMLMRFGQQTKGYASPYGKVAKGVYDWGKSIYDKYDDSPIESPEMSPGFPFVPKMEEKIY